jgi:inner membrane protein
MLLNRNHSKNPASAVIFTLNGCIHIFLDTLTGYILWSAPFGAPYQPFSLEPYSPWRPAILEVFVFLWAFYLWKKSFIVDLLSKADQRIDFKG